MKPTWVYSIGRCLNEHKLHVTRSRHPDSPLPQPAMPHGAVPIGQFHESVKVRRREPAAKSDADVVAVVREAFPQSERSRLRSLAAA